MGHRSAQVASAAGKTSAAPHVVLGRDLEPRKLGRWAQDDVVCQRPPQPESDTLHGHRAIYFFAEQEPAPQPPSLAGFFFLVAVAAGLVSDAGAAVVAAGVAGAVAAAGVAAGMAAAGVAGAAGVAAVEAALAAVSVLDAAAGAVPVELAGVAGAGSSRRRLRRRGPRRPSQRFDFVE